MNKLLSLLVVIVLTTGVIYPYQMNYLQPSDTLTAKLWTIEDGLPVNTLNFMVQDETGYIWFTTYDGLVRFDGLHFEVFNHANTPQMPHNRTTNIHIQDGIGIWVALEYGGVILIKDGTVTHFGEEEGFTTSDVTFFMEHSDGRMFFVSHDGLFVYENGAFSKFFDSENEFQNQISHAYEDADGSIYLSTKDGLIHIRGEEITEYNIHESQPDNRIFYAYRDSRGVLLVGTIHGMYEMRAGQLVTYPKYKAMAPHSVVFIYEDERVKLYSTSTGLFAEEEDSVRRVAPPVPGGTETYVQFYRDSNGMLWLVGELGELSIYHRGELQLFNSLSKLEGYAYNSMFEDRERNIWLLSHQNGLINVKRSIVKVIGTEEGLSGDNILGLYEDSRGRFWVGTRGDGLNKIENREITHYREDIEIKSDIIHSIAEDKEGNIWVGHYQKGLNKISDEGIEYYTIGNNVEINDVHSIFVARDSSIWLGTYDGLVKFDPEGADHLVYDNTDGMSGYKVRYIAEDKDGSLWVGTLDGGISHFKNGRFTNYTIGEGLSSNNIRSIYIDEDDPGTIWIGTENNGLNRLKNNRITYINVNDGLPDYNVHWISQDKSGWLWISTNKGVVKIDKGELNAYLDDEQSSFMMVHYSRREGMRNPEGNGSFQEAGIRASDGTFWFATQEGVAIFDAEESLNVTHNPTAIIKGVIAKEESFSGDSVIFENSINDFRIQFHAVTYINPEKTRFRYRVLNYAEEWKETGFEREVFFSDMPPGEYEFQVQATNSNGKWVPEAASVFLKVEPRIYQQVWFYVVAILLGAGLFYAVSVIRYRRLINNQERLQFTIQEQTKQIRKEKEEVEIQKKIIEQQAEYLEQINNTKDKFFSIIAHDLKNPFQAMLGYSEFLHNDLENIDAEELKEGIEVIRDSSKSLFDLTRNLLQWANLQNGQVVPEKEEFQLSELIALNRELFVQSAQQKNIKLSFSAEPELKLYGDKNMVNTMLRNLVSNAIKFTPKGGEVIVKAECGEEWCEIAVTDSGIGMNKEVLSGIMKLDAKSTRPGTENEQGTGLGLILCKELIGLHNGKLEVESKVNEGTTFTLKFPSVRNLL